MGNQHRIATARAGSVLALSFCALLAFASVARAEVTAPHIPLQEDTDACAMCHRAHSGANDATWTSQSFGASGSALVVGTPSGDGDVDLCYSCHGAAMLGASTDVETSFETSSAHSLAPSTSPYGASPKQCSSCHDSHGSERVATDTPYPVLLRANTTTDSWVYSGDDFCGACHVDRPLDTWDGIEVWRQTAHSRVMTSPANGTKIVCAGCHEGHGSPLAPLIRTELTSPAAPTTVAVSANDRGLCFVCHAGSSYTYPPGLAYQASAHGVSPATVTVPGEWAAREASRTSVEPSRTVGECQVCHAPMGAKDLDGNAIAKMAAAEGRELCDRCHDADGPAAADLASLVPPLGTAAHVEVAASYDPSVSPGAYGRVAVYAQETTTSQPRSLLGPSEFGVSGRSSEMGAGDLDGDGRTELVVADPGASRLAVFRPDVQRGLARGDFAIGVTADLVCVADVILDGSGLPEVVVVDRDAGAPYASTVYVYRYQLGQLTTVTPAGVGAGNDASGIAAGDVTATAGAEVVVTAAGDDQFRLFTESAGSLTLAAAVDTSATPRGPSMGDAWDGTAGEDEIVVASSGSSSHAVQVFDPAGALLGSYAVSGVTGAAAYDTLVADVLPGVAGDETVVAVRSDTDTSSVNVFDRVVGGGLSAPGRYDTGDRYGTGSLAAGDVNGDTRQELLAGNGGSWERTSEGVAPSVQVFVANAGGDALLAPTTLWGGGVELAGAAPSLAVADVGGSLISRHPVGEAPGTHVSTETAVLARHVECADCHNPHEATATAASAPNVYGALAGAWGVEVTNTAAGSSYTMGGPLEATTEFGVCLKCHSAWATTDRDIASEVNTRNASVHNIEEPRATSVPAGTLTTGWANDSVLFCVDCHSRSTAGAAGPHRSDDAPLLARPYLGTRPSASGALCYDCHEYGVYYTGAAAANSNFYDTAYAEAELHVFHANRREFGCPACHVSHGSPGEDHVIRDEVGFTPAGAGGSCTNDCHGGAAKSYDGS